MLRNSISIDMKVYALQLKHPPGCFPRKFCEILEQLLSRIILGNRFEGEGRAVTLVVIAKPFNLDCVFCFYKHEKGLVRSKILVAEIFGWY